MTNLFITNIILVICLLFGNGQGIIFLPKFSASIVNLSVAVGRDATFKCSVHHLGKFKVGWVKADTKAIQAIDKTVITHNSRISVSHESHGVWNLHIHDVRDEDKGVYMCQINTDPMINQVGHLEVLIPPDFDSEQTSSDILCTEGSTIRLKCSAQGRPQPKVIWRREDGKEIVIRREIIIKKHWNRPLVNYEHVDVLSETVGVSSETVDMSSNIVGVSSETTGVFRDDLSGAVSVQSRHVIQTEVMSTHHTPKKSNNEGVLIRPKGVSDLKTDVVSEIIESGVDNWWDSNLEDLIEDYQADKVPNINKLFNNFRVNTFEGEILKLHKISRHDMGPYLCIASNGVPPSISKRIIVHVHFPPVIHVRNQLVGAPLHTQVTVECCIEAFPSAIIYWIHNSGEIITSNLKYEIKLLKKSMYEVITILVIKNIHSDDLGTYQCIAKNSLGEMENNIRLYEIPGPTIYPFIQNYNDYEEIFNLDHKKTMGSKFKHFKHYENNVASTLPKDVKKNITAEKNFAENISKNSVTSIINNINLLIVLIGCIIYNY